MMIDAICKENNNLWLIYGRVVGTKSTMIH